MHLLVRFLIIINNEIVKKNDLSWNSFCASLHIDTGDYVNIQKKEHPYTQQVKGNKSWSIKISIKSNNITTSIASGKI